MPNITIDYRPTPKQAMYHTSIADELLYGGAAGGGKSAATVAEAGKLCLNHPGIKCYLFRRTYPELEQSLIEEAYKRFTGIGKRVDHEWRFPNGSKMIFGHCQYPKDRFKYQGVEIHALFIDELTHFSMEIYDYLKTRVRAEKGLHFKPRTRCTSNPGGTGHAWVKSKFVDLEPYKLNKIEIPSATLGRSKFITRQYIPARVTDNPHLTEDYIFELEQKPEKLRRALLNGSWDAFEGQVFFEWVDDPERYDDHRHTHVITPFEIPAGWPRYRSYDHGYAKPFSVLWWTVDPDGRVYLYREWYGAEAPNVGVKLPVRDIAKGIKEREANDGHVIGYADPAIWGTQTGENIADMMAHEGVYWNKGENDRIGGKMQLHNRLAWDDSDRPMLYVFSHCREFIRCIPALVYSETKVEDVDTDGEDHCYDAARYFLMSRPVGPAKKKEKIITRFDPLAEPTRRRSGFYGI